MISETLEKIFGTCNHLYSLPLRQRICSRQKQVEHFTSEQLASGGGIPNGLVIEKTAKDDDYSAILQASNKDARDSKATLNATFRPSNVCLFLRSDKELQMEELIERLPQKLARACEAQQEAFLAV